MRQFILLGFTLLLSTGLFGQTLRWNTPNGSVQAKSPAAPATYSPYGGGQEVETGYVTYYADYLVGQPTASGEFYQHELYTAAHRTLPYGTLLKVTRLDNNASVTVRVNDRGTLCDGCVLSISRGAAEALNMVKSGKITVAVQEAGFSNFSPRPEAVLTARGQSAPTQAPPAAYNTSTPQYNTTVSATGGWDAKFDDPNANRTTTPRSVYPAPDASPRAYGSTPRAATTTASYPRGIPESYEQGTDYTRRPAVTITPNNRSANTPAAYQQVSARSPIQPANPARAAPVGEVQIAANAVQGYGIQLGAFGNFSNAERRVVSLQEQGLNNVFIKQDADGRLSRVILGPFANSAVAKSEMQRLESTLGLKGLVMTLR